MCDFVVFLHRAPSGPRPGLAWASTGPRTGHAKQAGIEVSIWPSDVSDLISAPLEAEKKGNVRSQVGRKKLLC